MPQTQELPTMTTASRKSNSDYNFASELAELEKIVESLESENSTLNNAIDRFEAATIKANQLKKYLATAQLRVETLKKDFDK